MKKNIIKICVSIMLISILMLINSAALVENMATAGQESITGNISPTATTKIESTTIPAINPAITNTEQPAIAGTTETGQPAVVGTTGQSATEGTTKKSPGFGFIISILIVLLIYIFRNKMI